MWDFGTDMCRVALEHHGIDRLLGRLLGNSRYYLNSPTAHQSYHFFYFVFIFSPSRTHCQTMF